MRTLYEQVFSNPDLSEPLTLHHYDGTETVTTGSYASLAATPGEAVASWADSGPMVWCAAPQNVSGVSHVTVRDERRRCYFHETTGVADPSIG